MQSAQYAPRRTTFYVRHGELLGEATLPGSGQQTAQVLAVLLLGFVGVRRFGRSWDSLPSRRDIARSANTGISGFINQKGKP